MCIRDRYRTLRGVQLELFPYTKPMELLADIEAGVRFDVLFLDVLKMCIRDRSGRSTSASPPLAVCVCQCAIPAFWRASRTTSTP